MEKLTHADVNELTYFFGTPEPVSVTGAGGVQAQTYDPKGSGYDPATDMRLVDMVQAAVWSASGRRADWKRIQLVLEQVAARENGRTNVAVLRLAFGVRPLGALPVEHFRYPEVALTTKTITERASSLAAAEEYQRLLEVAHGAAMIGRAGRWTIYRGTTMDVAVRVLETERLLLRKGVTVRDDDVRSMARHLLEQAVATVKHPKASDVVKTMARALIADVRAEAVELVEIAGDAYRQARFQLGASKREAKEAGRKEREKLLDEQLGKKRTKETDRFEAKLARMRGGRSA